MEPVKIHGYSLDPSCQAILYEFRKNEKEYEFIEDSAEEIQAGKAARIIHEGQEIMGLHEILKHLLNAWNNQDYNPTTGQAR